MKLKLGIHAKDISFYISCVFYSCRIRTLVAMATYSFHKVEIDSFAVSLEIFNYILQIFLLSSPPFVQIA